MFGKMGQMGQMMKQVKALQEKVEAAQKEIEAHEIEGNAGAGMVKAIINGKMEVKDIQIDDSLINADEKDILQDLIIAAINDAKNKMDTYREEKMSTITGGMGLPAGMNLPF